MTRVLRAAVLGLLVACLAAVAPAALPVPAPLAGLAPAARAASDELEIRTAARYVVDPDAQRIHVTIDVDAVNRKAPLVRGGTVTRYAYDGVNLGVQPEAARLRVTQDGAPVQLQAARRDGYRLVTLRFREPISFQERAVLRFTYDLPAGKPRSESDVRVGRAFSTFLAWAFGDSGSVRVEVPGGYRVETAGSRLDPVAGAGAQVYAATTDDPIAWHATVNATDDAALTRDRLTLDDGEQLVIRGWPEDATWRTRVRKLLRNGVPELVKRIGLDWPVDGPLTVREVHTPLLEGYAGFYDPGSDEITISEDLDDLTVVHEASHAWFNGDLFTERWITEGLADEYAARVVRELGGELQGPGVPDRKGKGAFALGAWGPPAPIRDAEAETHERYGYQASWWVMRRFVQKVGETRMRDLFAAASAGTTAYPGERAPEHSRLPNDWRRLLDLSDAVGTPDGLEHLFETWVLDAPQRRQLDDRIAARRAYDEVVDRGGTWAAPTVVRMAMDDWRFAVATEAMDAATTALDRRDEVTSTAARAALVPPAGSEDRYQDADTVGELAVLGNELGSSLEALDDLVAASTAVAAPRDWLTGLGLDGADPDADLAAARAAWEAGDPALARSEADAAVAALRAAPEAGRSRALVAGGIGLAAGLVLLLVLGMLVRRRRRRPVAARPAIAPGGQAGPWPYATLPDHAAPAQPTADPAPGDEGAPRT